MNVLETAGRLAAQGLPFALATVVNVERPASARRGDHAVVTPDGGLVGWVGGACTEPAVVREALAALADGEARFVRVEGGCASEGTIELLVEPQLPAPLLAVIGDSPAARMLAELARTLGWRVSTVLEERADAVVVASMGQGDEEALANALAGEAGYVGLVASAKRGSAVLADLRPASSTRRRSRAFGAPRASIWGLRRRRRSPSRSWPSSSPGGTREPGRPRSSSRRSIRSAA